VFVAKTSKKVLSASHGASAAERQVFHLSRKAAGASETASKAAVFPIFFKSKKLYQPLGQKFQARQHPSAKI
jgi:hypothetical protein